MRLEDYITTCKRYMRCGKIAEAGVSGRKEEIALFICITAIAETNQRHNRLEDYDTERMLSPVHRLPVLLFFLFIIVTVSQFLIPLHQRSCERRG